MHKKVACYCKPVYPACAGIDPIELWRYTSLVSLPRMRGDRPTFRMSAYQSALFTPHARGSTLFTGRVNALSIVYPACAGIDRNKHSR